MAKKVTAADMPQKMRDDELFAHEVESVREAINTNADELAATTAAVVDAPTTAAEYVGQKGNSTLWRLGSAIRDKAKLRLQRFSAGTLPALLPAPVLAADRPGLPAPGLAFALSALIGMATPGPAAIAEYTRTVADGNHIVLAGSDLDRAQYPVYQNGYFYAASVSSQSESEAAVRLPRVGAAFDAALCWAWTGAGLSVPVVLNTARVKWEQNVWAPGLTVQIFGENLAQGNVEGGAGWVAIQQGSGPVRLYSLAAANPYRAAFTVPATVTPGKLSYWYHNGHGGEHGWSAKRTVDVVATAAHVLTHDFGQRTRAVVLDTTDAGLNVGLIRDAYQAVAQAGGGTFSTPAGSFPINDTIQPKDGVRWVCDSAATGGVTTLTAAAWVGSGNLGMFGSNFWIGGAIDGLEFIKTSGVKLADAEAVVVLNNLDQVQLRRTKARWNEPYALRPAGPVQEAVPAQPLRLGTSKNVFFDDCANTGSGINLGGSSNVFFTNYTHRATHNADYMLYSNNMLGWCMIGYDLRDLDPTSTDGADRGIRCIKSGGQNGRNRYRHLEKGVGTQLGIVRSGTNQAPDDNQFEQDLDEYNIAKYTDKVVRATAATVTIPRTLITQVNGQPVYLLKPDEHLVAIVAGRGAGQWRGIVSTTTDTITVDEPWLVVPDATSVLHTGWFSTDSTRYDVHYTAKPDNAQNPLYNHGSFYNGFGGVRGGIIDKCSGQGFRQGISFVATQHDATMVDQTAFNVVRNSQFPNSRWGRRFEAMPGQAGWAYDVPGLYCNLFSNCTYEAAIVAKLVYQLPRDTAGQVPNIAMLVEENQPVDVGLNDFSPSFYNDPLYPPKSVIPGTLTNSRQLVRQALSVIGAAGTLLLAGGDLGALEPLPAGSQLDTVSGMLSTPGVDAALLVFVDGAQVAPLARTAPASTSGGTPAPAPAATLYDAHYTATVAGAQPPITKAGATIFFNVTVNGDELVRGLDYTDDGQGTLTIDARDPVQPGEVVQYYWLTGAVQPGGGGGGYTDAQIDALLADKADQTALLNFRDSGLLMRKPNGEQVPLTSLPTAMNWVAGSTLVVSSQINLPSLSYNFPGPGTLCLEAGAVLTLNRIHPPEVASEFKITGAGRLVGIVDSGPASLDVVLENIDLNGFIYLYSFGGGSPRRLRLNKIRQVSTDFGVIVDYGNGGFYRAFTTVEITGCAITTAFDTIKWFDQISAPPPAGNPSYVAGDSAAQAANRLILTQNTFTGPPARRVLNDDGGRVSYGGRSNTFNGIAAPAQANAGVSSDEGSGQLEVQISSDTTNRVARIRLTKLRTLLAATAYASGNASSYVLQVNAYRAGSWVAGTGRTAVADVQADITALTAADYAAGAEMEIQVVPIAAGQNAGLVLQWAGAESVSFLAANRAARRTANNAPPSNYTGITSLGDYEETDTAHISLLGTWSSGPGAVHSGGACAVRQPGANGTVEIRFWLTNACRMQFVGLTDPSLGQLIISLDGSPYDTADQTPSSSSYQVYYTSPIISPGEHVVTISGDVAKTMLWDCFRLVAA